VYVPEAVEARLMAEVVGEGEERPALEVAGGIPEAASA